LDNSNKANMKNHINNLKRILFILLSTFCLYSCRIHEWAVPTELVGQWKSNTTKITVRTEPKWMKFEFTSDISFLKMTIDSNKTASGFIGLAEFKNGEIKKNEGNPERTGVAYIIKCGSIGKIFSKDPLDYKKVEIWLSPVKGDMHAELRYTEGNSQFPMADLIFRKVNTN